jgi:hypothetical protein
LQVTRAASALLKHMHSVGAKGAGAPAELLGDDRNIFVSFALHRIPGRGMGRPQQV